MTHDLTWQEKDGVLKAQANGFVYGVNPPHPVEQCWFLEIQFHGGNSEIVATEYEDCQEGGKEAAQSHANTVSAAIEAALAKERKLGDDMADLLTNFLTGRESWKKFASPAKEMLAAHRKARRMESGERT